MKISRPWILHSRICWMVLAAFCCLSLLPADSGAALIESRLADGQALSARAEQIDKVRQALEMEVVAQKLADFGLTPAEVQAKLPELSDEQLHQLASLSEDIAGGDVLGAVIAILVIVLLVVLILKISDKQVIIR